MGLFCSKRKKEQKIVASLTDRVQVILQKMDAYLVNWSPSFLTTSDIYTDVEQTSKKYCEMLKNVWNWTKAMPINSGSEPYIKRLEGSLADLRESYYKPHGLTAVMYAIDSMWACVTEWSENKY